MVSNSVIDFPLALAEVSQDNSEQDFSEIRPDNENLNLIFDLLLGQVFPFRGFILFDHRGTLLRSTARADEFCMLLHKGVSGQAFSVPDPQAVVTLPDSIAVLRDLLIESCIDFPEYTLQLYDTVLLPGGIRLHLNVEWIDLIDYSAKCILVTLDDLTQIANHRAVCDTYRYGLTNREAEVWELYLQGHSYRQVSKELGIALNTVKKHMKNIFSKCNIECRCRHLV